MGFFVPLDDWFSGVAGGTGLSLWSVLFATVFLYFATLCIRQWQEYLVLLEKFEAHCSTFLTLF